MFVIYNHLKYAVSLMKKLRIKTSCGLEKHNKLKMNKTFLGKLRLYWFNFFAILRDLNR